MGLDGIGSMRHNTSRSSKADDEQGTKRVSVKGSVQSQKVIEKYSKRRLSAWRVSLCVIWVCLLWLPCLRTEGINMHIIEKSIST